MYRELRILIAAVRDAKAYSTASFATTVWNMDLDAFGFKSLGTGAYGAVFKHADWADRVYKVGFDLNDAYLGFIMYAKEHPHVTLPKVFSIYMTKDFYVVEIEKLKPFYEGDRDLHAAWMLQDADKEQAARCFLRPYPELKAMYDVLGEPNDLHQGNYMWRGEQLVMTDPYAHRAATYRMRETGYWPEKVNDNSIKPATRMAPVRPELTVRPQEEDKALWQQPEHDSRAFAQGMAGVLSQVQREGLRAENFPPFIKRLVRVDEQGQRFYEAAKPSLRLQPRLRGLRPGQYAGAHMAIGRRADVIIADSISHRLEQEVRKVRNPFLYEWQHADFAAIERRVMQQARQQGFTWIGDACVKKAPRDRAEIHSGQLNARNIGLLVGPKPRQFGPKGPVA